MPIIQKNSKGEYYLYLPTLLVEEAKIKKGDVYLANFDNKTKDINFKKFKGRNGK